MDFNAIMQQAREMQEKMKKVQDELAAKTVTGTAGGGMVTVTASGKGAILDIAIEEALIDPGEKEMLQDMVGAAVNDALRKANELAKTEMAALTGGVQIPGLTTTF